MKLPEMTPLQFVVVHLLFCGPKTAGELRRQLEPWAAARSSTAFSKLMRRMQAVAYVETEYLAEVVHGQTIRQCQYRVTDLGVMVFHATREFYAGFAPPPEDLEVAVTDEARFAANGPRRRKELVKKMYARRLKRLFAGRGLLGGSGGRSHHGGTEDTEGRA